MYHYFSHKINLVPPVIADRYSILQCLQLLTSRLKDGLKSVEPTTTTYLSVLKH